MATLDDSISLLESISDDDKRAIIEARNKFQTDRLIKIEGRMIDNNRKLIGTLKIIIKKHINKDNYEAVDDEIVRLALECIKNCEHIIKAAEKEILLLAKHPVGSKLRPGLTMKGEGWTKY